MWFRNTWSWSRNVERPRLADGGGEAGRRLHSTSRTYGQRWLHCEGTPALLFTENETNT